MNIFQILGDAVHTVAIVVLIIRILVTNSCAGISGKSQILFALVFTTRYFDLFTTFISYYNTIMKSVFIVLSYLTVALIYAVFRKTHQVQRDHLFTFTLITLSLLVSICLSSRDGSIETFWTFSVVLESVAILPQLLMLCKKVLAGPITHHYLIMLALYRSLYIANWSYKYITGGYIDNTYVIFGSIQLFIYLLYPCLRAPCSAGVLRWMLMVIEKGEQVVVNGGIVLEDDEIGGEKEGKEVADVWVEAFKKEHDEIEEILSKKSSDDNKNNHNNDKDICINLCDNNVGEGNNVNKIDGDDEDNKINYVGNDDNNATENNGVKNVESIYSILQ